MHIHMHLKIMTDCRPLIILTYHLQLVSMLCDQGTYRLIGDPHGVCVCVCFERRGPNHPSLNLCVLQILCL